MRSLTLFLFTLLCAPAEAREISSLFIGNSYTYLPGQGTPEDPALPRLIRLIAESVEPSLRIDHSFHTPGGYSLTKHLSDPRSVALMKKSYDKVLVQGYSIEALDLPPWWDSFEIGEKYF